MEQKYLQLKRIWLELQKCLPAILYMQILEHSIKGSITWEKHNCITESCMKKLQVAQLRQKEYRVKLIFESQL